MRTRFHLTTGRLLSVLVSCLTLMTAPSRAADAASNAEPPNVVVIFIDDMGYADIGPFGAKDYPTPNLDRMAAEGMRFTDFVVSTGGLLGLAGIAADRLLQPAGSGSREPSVRRPESG